MRSLVYLSGAAAIISCASAGGSSSAARSSPDRIGRSEVTASSASNAYDLISRLRPDWLRARNTASISGGRITGQSILVYLDGNRLGDITSLRTLSLSGIQSLEWLDAARAETVLSGVGSDAIAGAILIKTQ